MQQSEIQQEYERARRNAGRVYPAMKEAERRAKKLERAYVFWAGRKLELQRLLVPIKVVAPSASDLKSKTKKKNTSLKKAAKAMSYEERQRLIQELQAME